MSQTFDNFEHADTIVLRYDFDRRGLFGDGLESALYSHSLVFNLSYSDDYDKVFIVLMNCLRIVELEKDSAHSEEDASQSPSLDITTTHLVVMNMSLSDTIIPDDLLDEFARYANSFVYPLFKEKVIIGTSDFGFDPLILPPLDNHFYIVHNGGGLGE